MAKGGHIYRILNAPLFAFSMMTFCVGTIACLGYTKGPDVLAYMIVLSGCALLFLAIFCRLVCGAQPDEENEYNVIPQNEDELFLLSFS